MVIRKSAKALHRLFWIVLVLLLFLTTVYVSLGRYYIDYIEQYQDSLVGEFVELTGLKIEVGRLYGTWSHLYPSLSMEQVALFDPENAANQVLSMDRMDFTIDMLSSLMSGSLQVNGLHVAGLDSQLEEFEPGHWRLRAYPYQAGDSNYENFIDRLLLLKDVSLDGVELAMFYADGGEDLLVLEKFKLTRSKQFRRARLELLIGESMKPLSILVESTGNPRDIENFSAEAYASFDSLDLSGQLSLINTLGFKLRDARINSELWGYWAPGGLLTIAGSVAIPVLDLGAFIQQDIPGIDNFSSDFQLQRTLDNNWNGWIANLGGEVNKERFSVAGLQFSYREEQLKLAAKTLSIDSLVNILLQFDWLEGRALDALTTLSPTGALENMHLEINTSAEPEQLFSLRANLDNVALNPWHGSPGATGVSGYITAQPGGGTVVLDSSHFTLQFPGVYHKTLDLGHTRAQVSWRIAESHVYVDSGPIEIIADHGPSTGLLRLALPLDKASGDPLMTLVVGIREVDASMRDRYIPYILDQNLLRWLDDSIKSGLMREVGFIYRGSLTAGNLDEHTVQLFLNVDNVALDYHPDWPAIENIDGMVIINDKQVDVMAESATVSGLALSHISAELDPLGQGSWLKVSAVASGSSTDAMRIVTGSEGLRRIVGEVFDSWQLSGDISAELELGIPLGNDSLEPEISFDSMLTNGNLQVVDYNLSLLDFSGPLVYSSQQGFSSAGIRGSFFNEPAEIIVSQQLGQPIKVKLSGQVSMKDVAAWTGEPALVFFSGKTGFLVDLSVGSGNSELQVNSDLKGVDIDLPPPYKKTKNEAWPFRLNLPLGESDAVMAMSLDDKASMRLQMAGRNISGGLLILGNTMDASMEEGFLTVTGSVQDVSWGEWYPRYERYLQAAQSDKEAKTALKVRQLYLGHLETFVDSYKDVLLDLTLEPRYWQLHVDTENIQGMISIPVNSEDPWLYELDKFVINTRRGLQGEEAVTADTPDEPADSVKESEIKQPAASSVFTDINPSSVQNANVSIKNLFMDQEDAGSIAFTMRSDEQGLMISELVGDFRLVTFGTVERPAQLHWYQDETGDHTAFNAELKFKSLGDVFDRWGYDRLIENKKGSVNLDIQWPAKPDEWTLEQSEGQYNLSLVNGSFLKTSGTASGALKIVSILNLNNILRRLKLDFSDLADEGVSFDDLEGGFEIKDAYLNINNPLLIHSPSSQFLFSGGTDIRTEQLDMELIATLPVAGNLPWVAAAFLGGLPVAAGVYVATKLFQDQVDKVSSAVYTFTGSWDDPELQFKKIYAGELTKKKASKTKKKDEKTTPSDATSGSADPQPALSPAPAAEEPPL